MSEFFFIFYSLFSFCSFLFLLSLAILLEDGFGEEEKKERKKEKKRKKSGRGGGIK